jgi:cyanoexosortase A
MEWMSRLREPKFWLLGLIAAIAAIHLTLVDRIYNEDLFATSALFWLAAGTLLWEKRKEVEVESHLPGVIGGVILLSLVLLRSLTLPDSKLFLCLLPLFGLLGLVLLTAGSKGLRKYRHELSIVAVLALYPLVERLLRSLPLSTWTAKAANTLFWYTGTNSQRAGVFLTIPGGRTVEVYEACSGAQSILQMIFVSALFLLMFSLKPVQRVITILVAIFLGFFTNAIRVCIMTVLVNTDSFEFWHTGHGSLIFSVISVALFGLFAWFAFLREPKQPPMVGDNQ